MTYAITTTTHMDEMAATVWHGDNQRSTLTFGEILNKTILHVPAHVAEHTAAAFNRAMQAEPQRDGSFIYQTDQGAWTISRDIAMGKVWLFQSEEVTGDGDPYWLSGNADSIMAALDAIDQMIADNSCTDCKALVGDENCIEVSGSEFICHDCAEKRYKAEASMQEMADDDRYHAWADDQREAAQ